MGAIHGRLALVGAFSWQHWIYQGTMEAFAKKYLRYVGQRTYLIIGQE
jgi:hypothetical protein